MPIRLRAVVDSLKCSDTRMAVTPFIIRWNYSRHDTEVMGDANLTS